MTDTTLNSAEAVDWRPEIIEKDQSLYNWPFKSMKGLMWLKGYLFSPQSLIPSGLALITWFFLTPDLARMQVFSWDWILLIYLRNVALLTLVVGTVHYRLYIRKVQESEYQYDLNGLKTNHPRFLFRSQVKENMFWGLVSGCGIWTAYEVVTYWMFANGYVLFPVSWLESPVYIVILFIAIPHIRAHHFYFAHRLTHWKPLYDSAHYLHHKNVNTGPWSGFSMHPIEHLIYLSGVVLHWVIPSHPIHACYNLMTATIGPTWNHSGYEKIKVNQSVIKTEYFHYLHHRYFECNYGNPSVPWDRLFGTFFDGSKEGKKMMNVRLKQRAQLRGAIISK
jgi:sterol desaturase/sphingolipid hydroxylase (fatty acid hydroxylase superfamily)